MQHFGTYQARVSQFCGLDRPAGDAALAGYAALYGQVERKLFADFVAGIPTASLKSAYMSRYGIPGRMFNGVRVSLDGKIASVREQQKLRVNSLKGQIAKAQKVISEAEKEVAKSGLKIAESDGQVEEKTARDKKARQLFKLHHKKRRLVNIQRKLASLEEDVSAGRVRLCFGSKKLWRKRNDLEVNNYDSHSGWLREWRDSRSDEFFVLGSKDETAGCQLCTATIAGDGTLSLRLRMPDSLAVTHGKYLVMEGVKFAYGHEQVLTALGSNSEYSAYRRRCGERLARATKLGQAISFRFKRDRKGWRVFATTEMLDVPVVTDIKRGAVGVDLNAGHLAVAETDCHGNLLKAWPVPLVSYGKSAHQAEALIGDAVAGIVAYAREAGKPIVIEKLDFRRKKAALEGESRKRSRMLSSFGYGKVKAYFMSRGYRHGVKVHQVNPAYSSVIGRVKFMERYGLSVHQAAALVLARRLLGCSERIPRRRSFPLDNGVHVAFFVPARKRVKHVWTYWYAVSRQLGLALAAQRRLGVLGGSPNPVRALRPEPDPLGVSG